MSDERFPPVTPAAGVEPRFIISPVLQWNSTRTDRGAGIGAHFFSGINCEASESVPLLV